MNKYLIKVSRLIPSLNKLYRDREKYRTEFEKQNLIIDELKNKFEKQNLIIDQFKNKFFTAYHKNRNNLSSYINYEFKFEFIYG